MDATAGGIKVATNRPLFVAVARNQFETPILIGKVNHFHPLVYCAHQQSSLFYSISGLLEEFVRFFTPLDHLELCFSSEIDLDFESTKIYCHDGETYPKGFFATIFLLSYHGKIIANYQNCSIERVEEKLGLRLKRRNSLALRRAIL